MNYIDKVLEESSKEFFNKWCSVPEMEKHFKKLFKQLLLTLQEQHNDYCDELVKQNNMVLDKQEEQHKKEMEEIIDYISLNQGWEETGDKYRKHFGFKEKYNN